MTKCNAELLRDYAFGELAAPARDAMERHLATCSDCAAELAQVQLTTAALRALPDQEVPQRIAFISDRVFEPSPVARFFGAFRNSGARLGFASVCVLSAAITFSAYRFSGNKGPVEIRTAAQTALPADLSRQIDARIDKAVSDAVTRVHEEDARVMHAAVASAEQKSERERRALMVAMGEQMTTLQKRLGVLTEYAMERGPERVESGNRQ